MTLNEIVEIRNRLKNDLATVERFLAIAKREGVASGEGIDSLSHAAAESKQAVLKPIIPEAGKNGYGSIGKTVLEGIKLCQSEFTVADVCGSITDNLKQTISKAQIATVLNRLHKQDRIQVLKKKEGRNAATYRINEKFPRLQ